jgi:exopolysaccharide biosynthesis polyprenyl glycosylphosphotransferase
VDLILVNGVLVAATALWMDFQPSLGNLWRNAKWFFTLSAVWIAAANMLDLYRLSRAASTANIVASTALAALLCAGLNLAIPWLTPPITTRTYAFGYVTLTVVPLLVWRVLYARVLVESAFHHRALILGAPPSAHGLVRELTQVHPRGNLYRQSGYHFLGLVSDRPDGTPAETEADGDSTVPWLGRVGDLASLACRYGVGEVVVALNGGERPSPEMHEALLDCRELGLQISTVAQVYERLASRLPVGYGQHDMDLILTPSDDAGARLYAVIKRAMDLALALVGLVGMAAAIPWVALANALWSPGPLFYRQTRTGKGGRSFVLVKFRSMVADAEKQSGAQWSQDNDPRITPVGRWLRKTRLDELPQFLNVLRGEMSAVGPRPERPHFVGQLTRELPLYRARHAVKPGVTGWAQIRYRYGNSVEHARRKLEYDLYYVKHASLYLDLRIVLQTARVVLRLRGQ